MEAGSPQGTEVIEARSSGRNTIVSRANAIRAIAPRGDQYFRVLQLVAHRSMKEACLREEV
jgi:hypothetical protein